MQIKFRLREGFGLDLEYTEDICHVAIDEDGEEFVLAFNGGIIKLPFCQIYFGVFGELEEWKKCG